MNRVLRWCKIDGNGCVHCKSQNFKQQTVISDELAGTWGLSRRERSWFDEREGHFCRTCHLSKRVRMLLWSLKNLLPALRGLHILHLNQTNNLSQILDGAGILIETAYSPRQELGSEINGLSNQDMAHLTFESNYFDLVIHSETLEHLHDYELALSEANRVLKPGGYHLYSVPLLHGRQTRRRIGRDSEGNDTLLLPRSAHGLNSEYPVVWEFGGDFIRNRQTQIDQIHYDNYWRNRTVFTIVEKKRR
jgi:SAM-dependent methyltransferase